MKKGYCPRCGYTYHGAPQFCEKCGANLIQNIKFNNERQFLSHNDRIDLLQNDAEYCIATLSKKEKRTGIVWIITSIIQLILSIICFPFPFWIASILNVIRAVSRFRIAKHILIPNKQLMEKYNSVWYGLSWTYNMLLGAVFVGLIGCICDERTRNYAQANAALIEWYCNVR